VTGRAREGLAPMRRAANAAARLSQVKVTNPIRPLTSRWEELPVESPGPTMLGISYRPLQAAALGLDPTRAMADLLQYPFAVIRLAAYWNQLEHGPGDLEAGVLDRQVDTAAQAGKKIIMCVGAVKAFGYPEFFVPARHLPSPLPEGRLVSPASHPQLVAAAASFVGRVVERYRDRAEIIAWQVAVRAADSSRPVLLTGFLPTSTPVRVQQRWRTRDQGDSLAVAGQLADVVGINFYPRHAIAGLGSRTVYLTGSQSPLERRLNARLCAGLARSGRRLMVTEGQAEPWETVTTPPSRDGSGMFSCLPEHVIENYNAGLQLGRGAPSGLWAYLFWGAEYWLKRREQGDNRYLAAFSRILAGG
jgi:hypothetical protein